LDNLSDFDYRLPEELIAQTPLEDRAASRLLWLRRNGAIEHRQFRDVTAILEAGDLLVLNDTRVSALRLIGAKPTGAVVEALLLREVSPRLFVSLMKPGKRLRQGATILFGEGLEATVVSDLEDGLKLIEFAPVEDLYPILNLYGKVPLPPYIHETLQDRERYQTVYGSVNGSSAAPTAGLHLTSQLIEELRGIGVEFATVTLHVGIDTFRPVQVENLDDHRMHGETCVMPEATANQIRRAKGRIIAVGTTTVRTLESFAVGRRQVMSGTQDSRLFIRPGYEFKVIDGMFTNFHLPRTTMLLMISALVGREKILAAYKQAVEDRYRFLSFGDSMLIL